MIESATDDPASEAPPTRVRLGVAGILTLMACLLYLDRYAVGIAAEQIRADLAMTQTQMSWFISLFFWSYALCQVPAGWFSDRFGPRRMLTTYVLGWSVFTGLMGGATQVWQILQLRLWCGATQAGAYPVCTGLIRTWFPEKQRGSASSIVALGGRSGAVLAPILTAALMAQFSGNWRPVLMVYGIVGVVIAVALAWICRDTPYGHPWCNLAERDLIRGTKFREDSLHKVAPSAVPASDAKQTGVLADGAGESFPWMVVLTNLSLWGNCLTQMFTNIGWIFVVTWLPRYLGDVHGIPLAEQALMTAAPTFAGIVGMFFGGGWTDFAARHFGVKWGRRLPVMSTRFLAAGGYVFCLALSLYSSPESSTRWLPWAMIAGMSFSTFSCDLGVPALWAYSQDVGGRYTASVMGWSNMFGNFGAALAPLIYNLVLGESPALNDWNWLFATCAGMFFLSGCCALVLDSTKSIAD
ncbi:MFS transporter [Schlesneria sp. DSM 10557]|uniref:MFS transporter n=1 Tax=Schlesneria sp. DSM 10557 TaxID=3044399 RepID=UPI0035A00C4F